MSDSFRKLLTDERITEAVWLIVSASSFAKIISLEIVSVLLTVSEICRAVLFKILSVCDKISKRLLIIPRIIVSV